MLGPGLFIAQRISAVVLAPLVLGHLIVMVYAVQGGLDSVEILARTRGSLFWGLFYGLFVVAVSVHAAIGVRVISYEWLRFRGRLLDGVTGLIALGLLLLGLRAVWAVVLA